VAESLTTVDAPPTTPRGKGGRAPAGFASKSAQLVSGIVSQDSARDWRVRDVQARLASLAPNWVKNPQKWGENHASRGLADLDKHNAVMQVGRGVYRVINLENAVVPMIGVLLDHYGRKFFRQMQGHPDSMGQQPESIAARRRVEIEARVSERIARELLPALESSIINRSPKEWKPEPALVRATLETKVDRLAFVVREVLNSTWRNPPVRRA
jgi:hypothetical protein